MLRTYLVIYLDLAGIPHNLIQVSLCPDIVSKSQQGERATAEVILADRLFPGSTCVHHPENGFPQEASWPLLEGQSAQPCEALGH